MGAKYWEIRESYGDRMGCKSPDYKEGYECGYEEGYQAAMEESEQNGSRMGRRGGMMGYRRGMDYEEMGERRGRDSMGRYR